MKRAKTLKKKHQPGPKIQHSRRYIRKKSGSVIQIPEQTKKDITTVCLFFPIVLITVALLSYHPSDPSIFNDGNPDIIHNLFGLIGAHFSGIWIGLFGFGSYWIPIILVFGIVLYRAEGTPREHLPILIGGLILMLSTSSLLAIHREYYHIWERSITTGGIVGKGFRDALFALANKTGAAIILILLWNIGFILTTGSSAPKITQKFLLHLREILLKAGMLYKKWYEKREKEGRGGKIPVIKTGTPEQETPESSTPWYQVNLFKNPNTLKKPKKNIPSDAFGIEFKPPPNGFASPTLDFLDEKDSKPIESDEDNLKRQSKLLEEKLEDFGVRGKVMAVTPGPVITTFEYKPAPGIKINKIVNLTDDLALALRAISIRIVAPIPGRSVIGIEIPNRERRIVKFREVVGSRIFETSKSPLTLCLGVDIVGTPVVAALDKMPHLLIAGATGTGKSVGLNAMICSFLFKSTPDLVKFIMIDPKRIELSSYDGIPHLITPVVTDVKKATNVLFWAVNEMERRYELLSTEKVRNITQFNRKMEKKIEEGQTVDVEKLPYIVIIIDELADLMMVASRDVEVALTRLAQMARASGIHLILATQRPSVNVLTGIIKANFPTRLSYQVSSKIDSRTIVDTNGAESLLGNGDMLFQPPGTAKLQRIHGPYISEEEMTKIIGFLKAQGTPDYDDTVMTHQVEAAADQPKEDYDELYDDAVAFVVKTGKASISSIQRHLRVGYNRAARMVEVMEKEGVVGPSDGVKPREVLVRGYDDMP